MKTFRQRNFNQNISCAFHINLHPDREKDFLIGRSTVWLKFNISCRINAVPLATPHADTPYEKRRHWI